MKKIVSFIIALCMFLSLSVSVYATKPFPQTRNLVSIIVRMLGLYEIDYDIMICGVRYKKVVISDDLYVKFVGAVEDNGECCEGKLTYSNGISATVDFVNERTVYSNGDIYYGLLVNLLKEGEGLLEYANGDIYAGEFKDDKLDGDGKYTYANGDVYEGEFKNDLKEGQGMYTFASGDVFIGTYVDNAKEGAGVYTWANGDVYKGDFARDCREGIGTYTWANGAVYEGEFKNNMMDGFGVYKWPSGNTYEGYFENGSIADKEKCD